MGTGIGIAFAAVVLVAMLAVFIVHYRQYRGTRIVTCPETRLPVGVEINAATAAGTWIVSQPRFVVSTCSRWPEHAGCDQACAPQVEASPEDTLVRSLVAKWYAGRTCVYCNHEIHEISGSAALPGLRSPDGELREWTDVAPQELPQLLASAVAVCASCELVEDFRRRYPDRVTDRPAPPPRRRVIAEASQAIY